MSVATFSLWVACYLLTLTFPIFVEWFNAANTFWIYAIICVIGFIVIFKYLPETKGISLEKLEKILVKPHPDLPPGGEGRRTKMKY